MPIAVLLSTPLVATLIVALLLLTIVEGSLAVLEIIKLIIQKRQKQEEELK